jgi:hypothetical protein
MKTQSYGRYFEVGSRYSHGSSVGMRRGAFCAYLEKRLNGNEADNPLQKMPEDGQYTWIKGRVERHLVYGVRNGGYEYDVRYAQSPGDKAWMEEKDKNYLERIEREGKLKELECAVWYLRQEEQATNSIRDWWTEKLKLPNLSQILEQAEQQAKQKSKKQKQGKPPISSVSTSSPQPYSTSITKQIAIPKESCSESQKTVTSTSATALPSALTASSPNHLLETTSKVLTPSIKISFATYQGPAFDGSQFAWCRSFTVELNNKLLGKIDIPVVHTNTRGKNWGDTCVQWMRNKKWLGPWGLPQSFFTNITSQGGTLSIEFTSWKECLTFLNEPVCGNSNSLCELVFKPTAQLIIKSNEYKEQKPKFETATVDSAPAPVSGQKTGPKVEKILQLSMKTQNFGLDTAPLIMTRPQHWNPHWRKRCAIASYLFSRFNSITLMIDPDVSRDWDKANKIIAEIKKNGFPEDGGCSQETHEKYSHVRYTEGPKDHAWMVEQDKVYLNELEKKNLLHICVPGVWWLWEQKHIPKTYTKNKYQRLVD